MTKSQPLLVFLFVIWVVFFWGGGLVMFGFFRFWIVSTLSAISFINVLDDQVVTDPHTQIDNNRLLPQNYVQKYFHAN